MKNSWGDAFVCLCVYLVDDNTFFFDVVQENLDFALEYNFLWKQLAGLVRISMRGKVFGRDGLDFKSLLTGNRGIRELVHFMQIQHTTAKHKKQMRTYKTKTNLSFMKHKLVFRETFILCTLGKYE